MKRFLCSLAGLLSVLVLMVAACAAPGAPGPAPSVPVTGAPGPTPTTPPPSAREVLLRAANKEAEVAVWANSFNEADKVLQPFREKFPLIKVKLWDASGDEIINKLVEEGKAGRITGDVFFDIESGLVTAMTMGLLQEHDWKTAGWPNQPRHKSYINYALNPRLPAFNTERIPVSEGPKSWDDLAAPKWRDKSPVASFSGSDLPLFLAYLWREEDGKLNWAKAERFLTDVVTNNRPSVIRGFPMELVVTGEFGIFLPVASGRNIWPMILRGAPMSVGSVGKTSGSTNSLGIVKNPAHPNAARVFADWFAAEGGLLSKIRADLVYAIDPEIAKANVVNQLLAKYNTEAVGVPTEYFTPENVKRANDFHLKVFGVKR